MTFMDSTSSPEVLPGKKRRGPQPRRRIDLPNGDYLQSRSDLAAELAVSQRTVARMKLPTTRVGGVCYHPHNESLNILASRIDRPGQEEKRRPPKRRRRR
jgi:hypothetical protein